MKKLLITLVASTCLYSTAVADTISKSQQSYIKRYEKQTKKVSPEDALLNTDPEPDLSSGFIELYNGENLDGWVPLGGVCTFEAQGEKIVGTVVKDSPSTYLSTIRNDYSDFIFTAELYWEVNINSGVMFRAARKSTEDGDTVQSPQAEMEGFGDRGWSGGIYGQSAGGWFYPLWLDAHEEARSALKEGEWNRVTIYCKGSTVKTWVNGVPAAHWETEDYLEGFFALQIHSGSSGEVHFRKIKLKELSDSEEDLLASGDLSEWTKFDGSPVAEGWQLEEGILYRTGNRPGDIITKKSYTNFDLKFDWKISKGGNSGVKFRTQRQLGLEYQILDDANNREGKIELHQAGAMYALVPPIDGKPLKPHGEWNHSRIRADGNSVQYWLNGVSILNVNLDSTYWIEQFNKSKYKGNKGFGSWTGPILLQDHSDKVWFKNIKITQLDP